MKRKSLKKKILFYIGLLILLTVCSYLFSMVLERIAESVSEKVRHAAETAHMEEEETDRMSEKAREEQTTGQEAITEQMERESETPDAVTEEAFQNYREHFSPEICGQNEKNKELLNKDTEELFLKSMADTLFIEYGTVTVKSVSIGKRLYETDGEVCYRICIHMEDHTEEWTCAYNEHFKNYCFIKTQEEGEDSVLQTE